MKKYSVYAIRPFSWLALVLGAAASGAAWYFLKQRDPSLLAEIAVGPAALVAFIILAVRGPIIRIGPRGVEFYPKKLPLVPWGDIAGVGRTPFVEPTVNGLLNHPHDGCRPVLLLLVDGPKYMKRLPSGVGTGLLVFSEAGQLCYRIDFAGLPRVSKKVYACIDAELSRQQKVSARNGP